MVGVGLTDRALPSNHIGEVPEWVGRELASRPTGCQSNPGTRRHYDFLSEALPSNHIGEVPEWLKGAPC